MAVGAKTQRTTKNGKAAGILLDLLQGLDAGSLRLTTPAGETLRFEGGLPGPAADVAIHDWRVVSNAAARGDVAFALDYRDGLWDSDDIAGLVELLIRNEAVLGALFHGNWLHKAISRIGHMLKANTKNGSRRNIQAHYDLGEDFYSLWLDKSMTYSCALFQKPEESLEEGQQNKLKRILDLLGQGQRSLIEIGCGWGSFAQKAAEDAGHDVTALTISRTQHRHASHRLRDKAKVLLRDYRDAQGKYDAVVSIEMFEAVGMRYWDTYFGKLRQLLAAGGKAVVQTILIDDARFDGYRRDGDMIRSMIFPGGMLPSPPRFEQAARKAGLAVADRHAFGQDYARTLRAWQERFDASLDALSSLGFDKAFTRLWRFYLAYCAAGFAAGRTDVAQYELRHA